MADSVSWLIQNQVLQLTLPEKLTAKELSSINSDTEVVLDQQDEVISIYINADAVKATYQTSDVLRKSLTFVHHQQLDSLIAVSNNKLTRLILLMAFSTVNIPIARFDNHNEAHKYVEQHKTS